VGLRVASASECRTRNCAWLTSRRGLESVSWAASSRERTLIRRRALRPAPVQAGPGAARPAASTRVELLERLARGEIALDQAMEELQGR
jgi:hypothetical protein